MAEEKCCSMNCNRVEFMEEEIGEKIRLFYVALTRAKEKIVMVASLSDESKDGEMVNDAYRLGIRCFEDMLNPLFDDLNGKSYIRNIDTSDYHFSKDYMVNRRNIFAGIKEERREITYKKLEEFLPVEIKQSGFSKGSAFVDEDTIRIMDFGTRMHYYLETLDFSNPEYEYIDKDFVSRIDKFLNSDIMLHKEKAIAHKEYEFIYEEDGNSRHGFIDLLMEYDDHFDIIDYKLKNIDDEHYDEQLNGYRRYIKSISSKKVNCYLYSIIDGVYREVKE